MLFFETAEAALDKEIQAVRGISAAATHPPVTYSLL